MNHPHSIFISLVSHTNAGKTTLARTLLDRDVGVVRDAPHVTEFAVQHVLQRSPEGDELILRDTPGFGERARLARRMQHSGNPIGCFEKQPHGRHSASSTTGRLAMKLMLKTVPPGVVMMALVSSLLMAATPASEAATPTTEVRAASEFEAIKLSGSIDLDVRQSGKESVTVHADAKLLPMVETVVESTSAGRTLHISFKREQRAWFQGQAKAVVEVVKLSSLSITGSGDARLSGLDADALEIRITGSGDVSAQGSARKLKVNIAGSGDAALGELAADDVTVIIAGSGDANVTANQSLTAKVAGSGDIRYGGRATAIRSSVAGSGSISRR